MEAYLAGGQGGLLGRRRLLISKASPSVRRRLVVSGGVSSQVARLFWGADFVAAAAGGEDGMSLDADEARVVEEACALLQELEAKAATAKAAAEAAQKAYGAELERWGRPDSMSSLGSPDSMSFLGSRRPFRGCRSVSCTRRRRRWGTLQG